MQKEDVIRAAALELGFVAAGFAAVGPAETDPIFAEWLAAGLHAGMTYLERYRSTRRDPRQLAAWARSIVVVAARYPANPSPGTGFSALARGEDYHDAVGRRLDTLCDVLERNCGAAHTRTAVDAAALAEREWAVRAGIGWLGLQGQVVSPVAGCCLVLGEILTDLDLAPTPRLDSQCGDCRLCVEACPAGALVGERRVDCRRCIAYLTIEHRGDIPEELRPRVGKALFGCDWCTAVCRQNRFGDDGVLPELRAAPQPSAEEILWMDEPEFHRRFAQSAVLRTGLERLQRNAAVALGNGGSRTASAVLKDAAHSSSPVVRTHAEWALARLGAGGPPPPAVPQRLPDDRARAGPG